MACHVEPDRPNSCCCIGQECAVPKITCDVSDRKPAPTCQEKKNLEFFLSSRPEHNQKPPTDTANRHCAFIPTRRKIAVWPQGAQSTAPLARGRSSGKRIFLTYERSYHVTCACAHETDIKGLLAPASQAYYQPDQETAKPIEIVRGLSKCRWPLRRCLCARQPGSCSR